MQAGGRADTRKKLLLPSLYYWEVIRYINRHFTKSSTFQKTSLTSYKAEKHHTFVRVGQCNCRWHLYPFHNLVSCTWARWHSSSATMNLGEDLKFSGLQTLCVYLTVNPFISGTLALQNLWETGVTSALKWTQWEVRWAALYARG